MNDFENGLCSRIQERIKVRGFCVVYDNDLRRLAKPMKQLYEKQVREIENFAAAHGLAVKVRETGINATFTPLQPNESNSGTEMLGSGMSAQYA
jgi:hypothetical protein